MHDLIFHLAQAQPVQPPLWLQLAPWILIFGLFYLLLVAPMRKRQREHQAIIGALKKGDRVVTSGGLHGEIAGVEDAVVFLKVADQVKIKVSRSAIQDVEGKGA